MRAFIHAVVAPSFLAVLAAGSFVHSQPAGAKEPFYSGKTIKVIIRSAPGGGYDFYGRLIARHLHKHISGKPRAIAVNLSGAGGVVAANYLAARAKRDGTEIAILNRRIAIAQRLKVTGVKYDVSKLIALGSPASSSAVWVVKAAHPIRNISFISAEAMEKVYRAILEASDKVVARYKKL